MGWFRRRHVKLYPRKSGSLPESSTLSKTTTSESLATHLPYLPTEILSLIVQKMIVQSDRDTLKAMRFLGDVINREATAILFHTIHLSASILSLDRLKNVAATPHIAPYIHRLVLHKGSWAISRGELYNDNRFRQLRTLEDADGTNSAWRLNSRGRLVLSPNTPQDVLEEKNRNLIAELRNQWAPGDAWIRNLKDFIRVEKFPNLTELHVPRWINENLSEYQIRQTGRVQTLPMNAPFDLRSIMSGIVYTSLKVLDLQDLYMDGFFEIQNSHRTFPSSQIERLEVLRLGFKERDPTEAPSFDWRYVLRNALIGLTTLLEGCAPSLKELYLRVGPGSLSSARPALTYRTEQVDTTQTVIRRHYPHLRKLTLVDFAVDEDTFINFLSLHSKTLEILAMTNWVMPVSALESSSWLRTSESSSLRAIWKIPQFTNLKQANLHGHFTTTNEEGLDSPCGWRAQHNNKRRVHMPEIPTTTKNRFSNKLKTSNASDSSLNLDLLEKIEMYLTHRGTFPFSDIVLYRLEANDYSFLAPIFEGMLHEEHEGNDQWVWTLDAVPQIIPDEDQDYSWQFVNRQKQKSYLFNYRESGPSYEPWSSWYRLHD